MRIKSFDSDGAILYLVATPIGNLSDFSYRAIEVLNNVDIIYAEDTRNSSILLRHYEIKTKLLSYHEFNQDIKSEEILNELKSGKKIAIISDAGLPVISDPGYKISTLAIENGIRVSTIPGASAGISALISSGLVPMPYLFFGFLESQKTKRVKQLLNLKNLGYTMIFYEAPHRIHDTLKDILEVLGDRNICIARELTKINEEFIRGKVSEIINYDNIKGEIVLIVEGAKEEIASNLDPISEIEQRIALGTKTSQAIKEVANEFNLDKNELYKKYLDYKNKGE
jgi:16S rRNA (cytidine1402-2'-O)-methyltransferase